MCHNFMIYSSVVGHLGCFQCLVIVNSAVMNIGVQVCLLYPVLCAFRWMPRSGITGSYGSSISSFWRNRHTSFHNGYTNLHSHQQCISVPVSPLHPHKHLLLLLLLIMAILTGVRWNLSVLLIWISFTARAV
jgi:hypothetical protein